MAFCKLCGRYYTDGKVCKCQQKEPDPLDLELEQILKGDMPTVLPDVNELLEQQRKFEQAHKKVDGTQPQRREIQPVQEDLIQTVPAPAQSKPKPAQSRVQEDPIRTAPEPTPSKPPSTQSQAPRAKSTSKKKRSENKSLKQIRIPIAAVIVTAGIAIGYMWAFTDILPWGGNADGIADDTPAGNDNGSIVAPFIEVAGPEAAVIAEEPAEELTEVIITEPTAEPTEEPPDILGQIPYYGDKSIRKLSAEQARAYAGAISEATGIYDDIYDVIYFSPALIDIAGDGVPLLVLVYNYFYAENPHDITTGGNAFLFGYRDAAVQVISESHTGYYFATTSESGRKLLCLWSTPDGEDEDAGYIFHRVNNGSAEVIAGAEHEQLAEEYNSRPNNQIGENILSIRNIAEFGEWAADVPVLTRTEAARMFTNYADAIS